MGGILHFLFISIFTCERTCDIFLFQGCKTALSRFFEKYVIVVAGVVITIGILQVFLFLRICFTYQKAERFIRY